jgi:hypothetical protein
MKVSTEVAAEVLAVTVIVELLIGAKLMLTWVPCVTILAHVEVPCSDIVRLAIAVIPA